MDYIEDAAPGEPAEKPPTQSIPEQQPVAETQVDPVLAALLTDDRNLRRRIVGALLRAVLADRRVT